jgi:hypothetical protein
MRPNRLTAGFEKELPQAVVRRVVLGSRRDLNGSPAAALPELVERLARQRLSSLRARAEERSVVDDRSPGRLFGERAHSSTRRLVVKNRRAVLS